MLEQKGINFQLGKSGSLRRARPTAPNVAAVLGLGTAVPDLCMAQEAIYDELLAPLFDGNPAARSIFQNAGVGHRHLAIEKSYYQSQRSTQERNARYLSEAMPLAAVAIHHCLRSGGWGPQQIDDLIVASCTGIDTPGLDLRLAALFDMRCDLRRATILGMGCYAALPALLRAAEAARAGRRALVVAIELCSLHFQPDDDSIENIVSAALFADGAAAILVGPPGDGLFHNGNGAGRPQNGAVAQRGAAHSGAPGPRLLDFETLCEYTTFEQMGFHLTDHGFQMRLGARVPDVLSANVQGFVHRLLRRNGLRHDDIAMWAIHPGSSKILDKMEKQLALPPHTLDPSRAVLRRYGNMSSPTILFVLEALQRQASPQPGDYGVMLTFGPGLTIEGALLQW